MTNTIETMSNLMKDAAIEIGERFDAPDDDWIPVMSLAPQEGENVMLAFDGRWLDTDESKDRLVDRIMVPAVNGVGAKTVATVFSAWQSLVAAGTTEDEFVRPSEAENRQEIVLLTVMDSFNVRTWTAEITRTDDSPPVLSDWVEMDKGTLGGRFVGAIQEALRDSSGKTDPKFMKLLMEQGTEIVE